uniref:Single-stranded DNA-binding protein n=1 Tax=Mastomys natalensis cytomegalovirus 1 TaxID=2973541 RepID=A0A9Y1IQ48_9BETA|nr:single-stranded DNA-binding protein [Mastomys natalensis cytomegalovirus 1]WEG68925.1 single-stranded DNA-binding protein [Mastomys natalensis cytomegalovirus 1]WEG71153.1 single-stranded DNA-binding protein [Mastomys natalensis cytomegalovirus 1]
MAEEDLSALAPVAPAGWLFFTKKSRDISEILSVLSLCDKETSVVIAPLLIDLTVDRDFSPTVRTPMTTYEGGVLTKVTSFCPFAFIFHNTSDILEYVEDHGDVKTLCEEARRRFNVQSFVPLADKRQTDVNALCERLGINPTENIGHVVCGNGMKELLYFGHLIPCVEEATHVQVGSSDAVKVPLYPSTLFVGDGGRTEEAASAVNNDEPFVVENGFYVQELSECLFYFVFTAWGQSLRVVETQRLIDAGLQQFVNDTQQNVKLAPFKKYHGYGSQKLSAVERDQLMVVDAVCAELAFSYASVYFDSVYDAGPCNVFSEWPVVKAAKDHNELMDKLYEFQMHLSTHIAALVFSSNSILYQTRIVFIQNTSKSTSTPSAQESLLKSIRFFNGFTGLSEDILTDSKKSVRFEGSVGRDDKYSPYHLAFFCGTSPQLVSAILWFFNRMAVYSTGVTGGDTIYQHIVNSTGNLCTACGGRCCQTCYVTAFVRMASRLPAIPKQIKKEPMVVSLLSRAFCDADVMGNYGRKYGVEARENIDGPRVEESGATSAAGLSFVAVDRMKYLGQIMDYCKKNSLIDAVTGEDIVSIRSKRDFVTTISALNSMIDDCVHRFTMDVRRSGHGREEIAGSTQSFNLDLNPYAMSFSPILSFSYYRTVFSVIQNLALINAISYVVDNPLTSSQISRWLNQHFQSICGAFGNTPLKKGFLNVKDIKNQKSVEFEKLMDFKSFFESGRYHKVSMEIKSCKMSVQTLRSCRIKNRPISKVGKSTQVNVFFKRGAVQRKNPVKGCLSFLLHKCHEKIFSGCGMSCLEFWQRVFQNSLPKTVDVGKLEDFDMLVKFLLSVTDEYDENDVIDAQPDCIVNYVENRFHNKFLGMFGFRDYISTVQGLTTRLTAQNHMHFPYLLKSSPKFSSMGEYVIFFKKMKLDGTKAPLVSTVSKESVLKNVFESRSLISVGFAIEKFTSTMTTRDVFQFGQIGYFVGGGVERSLNVGSMGNQDFRFMRHRHVLATKMTDVIIRRSRRESILYDADIIRSRVLSALDASAVEGDPELLAIVEIMHGRDGEAPEFDDILFYVDHQEYIATALHEKIQTLVDRGTTDFSLQSLRETLVPSVDAGQRELGETYDFSSLFVTRDEVDDVTAGLVNGDDIRSEDGFELPSKRCRL